MTISEILACEIPEGKYELALKTLWYLIHKDWLYDKEHNTNIRGEYFESHCAAFTVLWEISTKTPKEIALNTACEGAVKLMELGYKQAILTALEVVDDFYPTMLKVEVGNFEGGACNAIIELRKSLKSLLPSGASEYVRKSEVKEMLEGMGIYVTKDLCQGEVTWIDREEAKRRLDALGEK